MRSHFTAEFFKGNRQRLIDLAKADYPVILTANGLLQMGTDMNYPFKQDGSFWYLTGVDDPNVRLVIDGDTDYLIIPELSATREAFDGAIDAEKLQAVSGVKKILYAKEGDVLLSNLAKNSKLIGTLLPADAFIESLGMFTNPARQRLLDQLRGYNNQLEFTDLRQTLGRLRMVKQPVELTTLQQAIDITTNGINAVHERFIKQRYKNEFEIELALTEAFHANGGSGHSFEPIVAGGIKAATIHPSGNNKPIDYAKGMLLDVGAEFDHYAADISRTWAPPGDKRFETVFQAVKDVADYAMSLLKPGVKMREYEQQVESRMGEELLMLGLIKKANHETIREYFPHATSHFLGIDVHDSGDYDEPLSEGVVITVEPGIYIPKEGIGVRIEDDVVITEKGCQSLSTALDE